MRRAHLVWFNVLTDQHPGAQVAPDQTQQSLVGDGSTQQVHQHVMVDAVVPTPNERIAGIDGNKVRLRVRADASGGKRTVALDGVQFIACFLQHVLPGGFKRIRHYGLLAPAAKSARLALARQALAMLPANPQAREDAQAFMRGVAAIEIDCCPHCKTGRWLTLQVLPAQRLHDFHKPARNMAATCRGPP